MVINEGQKLELSLVSIAKHTGRGRLLAITWARMLQFLSFLPPECGNVGPSHFNIPSFMFWWVMPAANGQTDGHADSFIIVDAWEQSAKRFVLLWYLLWIRILWGAQMESLSGGPRWLSAALITAARLARVGCQVHRKPNLEQLRCFHNCYQAQLKMAALAIIFHMPFEVFRGVAPFGAFR